MTEPALPLPRTMRERVQIGDRTFLIDRPILKRDVPDRPQDCFPFVDEDNPPEWSTIWPAGRMLAKAILQENWPAGCKCVEVGCGLGLVGIAALSCGLDLMFTDFNTIATELATHNARLNGFNNFRVDSFDWSNPPADLKADLIVGSDVVYMPQSHELLFKLVERVLEPGGTAMLADPNRGSADLFVELVKSRGWHCARQPTFVEVPAVGRVDGSIYRITHPSRTPS